MKVFPPLPTSISTSPEQEIVKIVEVLAVYCPGWEIVLDTEELLLREKEEEGAEEEDRAAAEGARRR